MCLVGAQAAEIQRSRRGTVRERSEVRTDFLPPSLQKLSMMFDYSYV